jgi:hypothetical protein
MFETTLIGWRLALSSSHTTQASGDAARVELSDSENFIDYIGEGCVLYN